MKDPRIKTRVVHSQTKAAWNVVCETPGRKYKIARVPYGATERLGSEEMERIEAFSHAAFISWCFNNSDKILENKGVTPPTP